MGDKDKYLLGDALIPDIQALVPSVTVQHFANGGHFLMYDDPPGIVSAIKTFAAKL